MMKSLAFAHFNTSFQFITHQNERFSYLEGAYMALIGGCRWVQLRMKGATDEEVEPIARKLQVACKGADATFVLDDRVELVKKLGVDGVHLGKNDMPVDEARKMTSSSAVRQTPSTTSADCMPRVPTTSVAGHSAIPPPSRSFRPCWDWKATRTSSAK